MKKTIMTAITIVHNYYIDFFDGEPLPLKDILLTLFWTTVVFTLFLLYVWFVY